MKRLIFNKIYCCDCWIYY